MDRSYHQKKPFKRVGRLPVGFRRGRGQFSLGDHPSQGLRIATPRPSKSLTLRVANVRSCSNAVAAIRPSLLLLSGHQCWAAEFPYPELGLKECPTVQRLLWLPEEGALQTTAQDRAPTTPSTRCAVCRRQDAQSPSGFRQNSKRSPTKDRDRWLSNFSDAQIGCPSSLELREDVGVEKESAHRSTGRP